MGVAVLVFLFSWIYTVGRRRQGLLRVSTDRDHSLDRQTCAIGNGDGNGDAMLFVQK